MLLEKVQRGVARFVCGNFSRVASVSVMLKMLGWESLEERRLNSATTDYDVADSRWQYGKTMRGPSHCSKHKNQDPEQYQILADWR